MESGTLADGGIEADFAMVGFDDPFADSEAQAGASGFAGAGGVGAIEAVEDACGVLGGDAGAGVVNVGDGETVVRAEADVNLPAAGGVLDGVVEQDHEEALERSGISLDPDRRLGKRLVEGEMLGFGENAGFAAGILQDSDEIVARHGQQAGGGVGAREEEKLLDHARDFFGFVKDAREGVAIFGIGARLAQGEFGVGAQDGNGRAKLVRGVGGELCDALKGVFQAREHFVEGSSEAVEFIAGAGDLEALGEVVGADAASGLGDLVNGSKSAAAEEVASERGKYQKNRSEGVEEFAKALEGAVEWLGRGGDFDVVIGVADADGLAEETKARALDAGAERGGSGLRMERLNRVADSRGGVDQRTAEIADAQTGAGTFAVNELAELVLDGGEALRRVVLDDVADGLEAVAKLGINGGANAVAHGEIGERAKQTEGERQNQRIPGGEARADGQRFHSALSGRTQ